MIKKECFIKLSQIIPFKIMHLKHLFEYFSICIPKMFALFLLDYPKLMINEF